jgi:hypothetical protein
MNAYYCEEFCRKWHVGNTYPQNAKAARREREEGDENNSLDKASLIL